MLPSDAEGGPENSQWCQIILSLLIYITLPLFVCLWAKHWHSIRYRTYLTTSPFDGTRQKGSKWLYFCDKHPPHTTSTIMVYFESQGKIIHISYLTILSLDLASPDFNAISWFFRHPLKDQLSYSETSCARTWFEQDPKILHCSQHNSLSLFYYL